MERKIGEIFEYNNEWYQCVDRLSWGVHCNGCDFLGRICSKLSPKCSPAYYRSDGLSVIFKKLKKIGEPYKLGEVLIQQYQGIAPIVLPEDSEYSSIFRVISSINVIEIEIKKTKKGMEEKKLNLKPFDIQKAREGKPVCTRDGHKARIICFDKKGVYPIVALVNDYNEEEYIKNYDEFGKKFIGGETSDDLMMLPEKRIGWINIYKGGKLDSDCIYPTKADALENIFQPMKDNYIDTIKVEWEE